MDKNADVYKRQMLGNEIGISYEMGALIACVVFIVYPATSGLFGVIYTLSLIHI